MCDLLNERIRINKILQQAIDDGFGEWSIKTDELVQHCFLALQAYYDGSCVEECLKKKAEEFVSSHLARARTDDRPSARKQTAG